MKTKLDIKEQLIKAGRFLRILDETDVVLSITNITVFLILYKIISSNECNVAEMSGLFIALSGYFAKKHLNKNKTKLSDENKKAIEDVTAKVQQIADKTAGLAASIGLRNPLQK